jgi:outer membrane protein TolC
MIEPLNLPFRGFFCGIALCFGLTASAQAPAPLTIDLSSALQRARTWSPQFLAAALAAASAKEDRVQAKAAFFPTVSALNGFLYTQGNGTDTGVFVANNGVHIYDEQLTVHADVFSATKQAQYKSTLAAEAAAKARQDVARRGLATTVIQNYYGVISANRHRVNAVRALNEARQFEELSQKQERGGEVARADVVKAQLQRRQREQQLNEAEVNVDKAKLALAVLIFQDLMQPYEVVDDLKADAPAPAPEEGRQASFAANPDLQAAEASLRQANSGVAVARGDYFPLFTVDYFFGINSNVLSVTDPLGNRNIGSVVQATVTVPVWNWGSTRSKVRQAQIAQQQAQNDLNFAKRQVESNLDSYLLEARAARTQLAQLLDARALSEENLRLTTLRYEGGEATALEIVDAQSTASDARNGYDDGLGRYRLALANLEILMGRY